MPHRQVPENVAHNLPLHHRDKYVLWICKGIPVTTSLPLTISANLKALPQGQSGALTGGKDAPQGAESFADIIQSIPDKDGQRSQLVAALKQLFPAISEQGGKDLPASLTLDQLIGLIQKGGIKLDKSTLDSLQAQEDKSGVQVVSPELMALLQSLVNGGVQPADPKSGDAVHVQASTAGQAGAGAGGQSGPMSLSQLLTSLTHGGQDTAKLAQDGQQQQQPPTAAAATTSQQQEAAYIRQILAQAMNNAQANTQSTPVVVQGDTTATDGNIGTTDIISKLFGTSITPERAAALEKDLAAAGLRGGQTSPPAGTPGAAASSNNPTQFLSALMNQPGAAAQTTGASQPLSVSVPMNQPGWDQALGQNVLWMAKHDVHVASIKLNPPQLGPLEVRITFNHDQANVNFISHHGVVREAVEAALPRLREMFGEGGVNLANVDVSDDSSMGQQTAGADSGGSGGGSAQHGSGAGEASLAMSDGSAVSLSSLPAGLVDYFA